MNEKSLEKAITKGILKATGIATGVTLAGYAVGIKTYKWYSKKVDEAYKKGKEVGKIGRC